MYGGHRHRRPKPPAFGVLGALIIAGGRGRSTGDASGEACSGALRMTCMIMFILAGCGFLTVAMGFTGIPEALVANGSAASNCRPTC